MRRSVLVIWLLVLTGLAVGGGAASAPALGVNPTQLSFTAQVGGSNPPCQSISLSSSDDSKPLTFSVTSDSAWLTVNPAKGTTPASIQACANIAQLSAGTFKGNLNIAATDSQGQAAFNSPVIVAATLRLAPRPDQPPVARFMISPTNPKVGDAVSFDASSSSDPDGKIVNYAWDFGDGNKQSVTAAVVQHAYTGAGNFTVTLTVTDDANLQNSTSQILTLQMGAPAASFIAVPTTGLAPLTVQFTNKSTNFTSSSWDFGDGSTSSDTNPTHTYQNVGSYTATLVVRGPGGQAQASATISVTGPSSQCGDILFQDDFSDPNSGWIVGSFYGFDWSYTGTGEYRVLSGYANSVAWSWAPKQRNFTDFCLEVDVEQVVAGSLSGDGAMGLIFGGNPQGRSWTGFAISSGRDIFSVQSLAGESVSMALNWQRSKAIQPVNTWNHLLVVARNGSVSLYINDTLASTGNFDTNGAVGVFVETFNQPNTNAHFKNFKVRAIH
jgi:PKD repeat protein